MNEIKNFMLFLLYLLSLVMVWYLGWIKTEWAGLGIIGVIIIHGGLLMVSNK